MRRALQKVTAVARPHCVWSRIEFRDFRANCSAFRETANTDLNEIEQRFSGKLRQKTEAELQELLFRREQGMNAHSKVDVSPETDQMVGDNCF
jgi:hypothetical protein